MNFAKEILRFGAATLALALIALSAYAQVILSFFMTCVPFVMMLAAFVFLAIRTSRSWRVLLLAATSAALLPTLSVALRLLGARSGPPAKQWEGGQFVPSRWPFSRRRRSPH
jgi:hypothetical protein